MAKFTFNMPDIGEGIAEAEIVQWHKQVGDQISRPLRAGGLGGDEEAVRVDNLTRQIDHGLNHATAARAVANDRRFCKLAHRRAQPITT